MCSKLFFISMQITYPFANFPSNWRFNHFLICFRSFYIIFVLAEFFYMPRWFISILLHLHFCKLPFVWRISQETKIMLFRFVFVPIKRYSLFSFFFIQNFKRWEGGWFWSYFFRVIFFWCGGGPESRVQSPVHGPVQVYGMPKRWHDKYRQGNTTNRQDNRASRQDDTTRRQGSRTSRQDDTTNWRNK